VISVSKIDFQIPEISRGQKFCLNFGQFCNFIPIFINDESFTNFDIQSVSDTDKGLF